MKNAVNEPSRAALRCVALCCVETIMTFVVAWAAGGGMLGSRPWNGPSSEGDACHVESSRVEDGQSQQNAFREAFEATVQELLYRCCQTGDSCRTRDHRPVCKWWYADLAPKGGESFARLLWESG